MNKKVLSIILFCALVISLVSCGDSCLPDKKVGDVVMIKQQTMGATDRKTYNKMMEAAKKGDNRTTAVMLLAGQLRIAYPGSRGTLVEKDGSRVLVKLPDGKEWWFVADFLE